MKRAFNLISKIIICVAVMILIHMSAEASLTVHATAPEEAVNGAVYRSDGTLAFYTWGEFDPSINGLVYVDNLQKWIYFENGIMNTDVYEFVYYNGAEFLVANGEVADLTGLVLYDYCWYYLAHGQKVDYYEGLTLYDGEWFYVRNGMLATDVNDLCYYDGETFLVAEGRLLSEYTGLYQNKYGYWHWIVEGRRQEEYTGPVEYDGKRFMVEEGTMYDKTGKYKYKGEIYVVSHGELITDWESIPDADIYGYVPGDTATTRQGNVFVYQGNDRWADEDGYIWYSYLYFDDSIDDETRMNRAKMKWFTM